MNLFNQDLSFEQLLHYDSIIDGKGMDSDVLLLQQALHQPTYNPFNQQPIYPSSQQPYQQPYQQPPNTPTQNNNKNTEIVKKNKKRVYIALPNARIAKHQHKYRKHKVEEVII